MPSGTLSLFLEATQLKTERTVIAVLRADPTEAEVQEVGGDACYCRRPAVSAGAGGIQFSRTVFSRSIPAVAEARGCFCQRLLALRDFEPANEKRATKRDSGTVRYHPRFVTFADGS